MKTNLKKWINSQTQLVFGGIGPKPNRRGNKRLVAMLAVPFFFVPVLIAGFAVMKLGDSYSKHAVAFLRAQEVKPEAADKITVVKHRARIAQKKILASNPLKFKAQP